MYFKYFIIHNNIEREVKPLNEGELNLKWAIIKDSIKNGYTFSITSNIVLSGSDYQYIKGLEATNFCDLLYFTVKMSCDNFTFTQIGKQQFYITDIEFKTYRCKAIINLQDAPDCPNISKNYNLINAIGTRYGARIYPANISIETVQYDSTQTDENAYNYAWITGDINDALNAFWLAKSHVFEWDAINSLGTNTTIWAREVLIDSLTYTPDSSWTLIETNVSTKKWARNTHLFNCDNTKTITSGDSYIIEQTCETFFDIQDRSGTVVIPNGIHLKDALTYFATQICGATSVTSNFFQINPSVTTNINYVTGEQTQTDNILIFDLSDAKRPNSAQQATVLNLSFESLMKILKGMFDVEYKIIGGVLTIEHISYFNKTLGIDTTIDKYKRFSLGKDGYKYNELTVPKTESWAYTAARYSSAFRKAYFDYADCVTDSEDKLTTIECVTDLMLCLSNSAIDSSVVSDDGVFVAACKLETDGSYSFLSENEIDPNNVLGIANLLEKYHTYERPFTHAELNGVNIVFNTVRMKDGENIKLPYTCSDILSFSAENLVKTYVGDGEIQEATYNVLSKEIEFKLKY